MKKEPDYLEKMRFQNMILLVLGGIGAVISIIDLPSIIVKSKQVEIYDKQIALTKSPELIAALEKSLALVTHPIYRLYALGMFVLSLVLFVGFYTNNKGLKDGYIVTKWPYYMQIFKIILAMGVSIVTQALAFNVNTSVLTIFLNLVWCIPAILVLKHRKAFLEAKATK